MGGGRILVIKLGALGDFVQALGAMAAIRRHHSDAHIVLLTMAPFEGLARASRLFDEIWLDRRAGLLDIPAWLALRRRLRAARFDRVYDLQTSDRTSWYFRLLGPGPRPEWSGIARGASHPHANPRRDRMHSLDRLSEQLAMTGVTDIPAPDLSWAAPDLGRLNLPERFAFLAPGGAEHRPGKRWPVERYAALAQALQSRGLAPVVIGTAGEHALGEAIREQAGAARNLAGATTLDEVAGLARQASLAVGNDTGPMHMAAAAGTPALVLFSAESDPALCAPRGASVTILRRVRLAELAVEDVLTALPAPRS